MANDARFVASDPKKAIAHRLRASKIQEADTANAKLEPEREVLRAIKKKKGEIIHENVVTFLGEETYGVESASGRASFPSLEFEYANGGSLFEYYCTVGPLSGSGLRRCAT